jgi:2-oxoglutarate ferredoxin oxidoreductase subunit beta
MTELSCFQINDPVAWCPGCGNFGILNALKQTLSELEIKPENLLLVSGIGQSAKLPHYLRCNTFNGLHGRTLPVATGAKIANHKLVVIADGGDGDGYAEGGNHFIHSMRRNLNITYLVHNNQIYGLTKGQTSPTTDEETITGTAPKGSFIPAERPLALAVASGCSFVARGFSGDKTHLVYLIEEAVKNNGFSLLDILQPCVTFNNINTFKWYQDRIYKLEERSYDPYNRTDAFNKALEWGDKIPIGIIFKIRRKTYEDMVALKDSIPLAERNLKKDELERLYKEFY